MDYGKDFFVFSWGTGETLTCTFIGKNNSTDPIHFYQETGFQNNNAISGYNLFWDLRENVRVLKKLISYDSKCKNVTCKSFLCGPLYVLSITVNLVLLYFEQLFVQIILLFFLLWLEFWTLSPLFLFTCEIPSILNRLQVSVPKIPFCPYLTLVNKQSTRPTMQESRTTPPRSWAALLYKCIAVRALSSSRKAPIFCRRSRTRSSITQSCS